MYRSHNLSLALVKASQNQGLHETPGPRAVVVGFHLCSALAVHLLLDTCFAIAPSFEPAHDPQQVSHWHCAQPFFSCH